MSPISIAQQSDHRDIPLPLVTSGSENSGNLRELALNRMKDFGAECRDVRFREVGVMHSSFRFRFTMTRSYTPGRYTRSTTKFDQNRSSYYGETIPRTVVGKPSFPTRILSEISSSDCFG